MRHKAAFGKCLERSPSVVPRFPKCWVGCAARSGPQSTGREGFRSSSQSLSQQNPSPLQRSLCKSFHTFLRAPAKGFHLGDASMLSIYFQTLSFASIVVTVARAQTCWYPDGKTQALNNTPCHRGTHSTCCGQQADGSSAYCLSNGLCLSDMAVTRGSCTDGSWQSPACSSYCRGKIFDLKRLPMLAGLSCLQGPIILPML